MWVYITGSYETLACRPSTYNREGNSWAVGRRINGYVRIQYLFTIKGGGVVANQREGERGNRGEYRSKSWVENTNMTDCTQEIGYLQSINSLFVELEKCR